MHVWNGMDGRQGMRWEQYKMPMCAGGFGLGVFSVINPTHNKELCFISTR